MKKILLVYNQERKKEYSEILKAMMKHSLWKDFYFEEIAISDQRPDVSWESRLQSTNAEFIVGFDLEGFQYKTLLDNYLYNIIPLKQLHLITDRNAMSEAVKAEAAMNLFIYIPCRAAEELQGDEEIFHVKYYPAVWLEEKEKLVNELVIDFMKSIK